MRISLAVVIGPVLAITACSSSKIGTGTSGQTAGPLSSSVPSAGPAVGPSSATPSPSSSAVTATQLRATVVQPGDLPASWKGTPDQPDAQAPANDAKFAACQGIKDTTPDKVAEVDSDDYDLGDAEVSSQASSFPSSADVQSDIGGLTGGKAGPCYEQLIRAVAPTELPAGTTLDDVQVTITPAPSSLPSNVVAIGSGSFSYTADGTQQTLYEYIAFISGTTVEAQVGFTNVGQRIDPAFAGPIITKVADRIATV